LKKSAAPSLRLLFVAMAFVILYPPDAQAAPAADRAQPRPAASPSASPQGHQPLAALPSLARQFALGVKLIVIDPGHGGRDTGAISCNRVTEKDITLAIAQELKGSLETAFGCKVILTRTRDQFVTLDERTRMANAAKADLFVSIHANAHKDPTLSGIETYSLNFARDQESARVAALENAPSKKTLSDIRPLLQKLLLTTKTTESESLAKHVQRNIIAKLRAKGDKVRDLGVKQAPFLVLLGADMPSVLIETAFLTNARDECRLKDRQFQQNLVKGITLGIESYLKEIKRVAKAGERS
jgi:N-acetylmuramoyl-L-alanine amidase